MRAMKVNPYLLKINIDRVKIKINVVPKECWQERAKMTNEQVLVEIRILHSHQALYIFFSLPLMRVNKLE